MSLTIQNVDAVLKQLLEQNEGSLSCPRCNEKNALYPHDDGYSSQTEWGVSGAYVSCDTCGYTVHRTQNMTSAGLSLQAWVEKR